MNRHRSFKFRSHSNHALQPFCDTIIVRIVVWAGTTVMHKCLGLLH